MTDWTPVAQRVVAAFEIDAGGLVVIRDRCGRPEVVDEVVIAFERRGITVLIDSASDHVLGRVLTEAEPALLESWGRHRAALLESADGVVSLGGGPLPDAPREALSRLSAGRAAMEEVESCRRLPFLAVAVPTPRLADHLGTELATLDAVVQGAVSVPTDVIRERIDAEHSRLSGDELTLRTEGCTLRMSRADRRWLVDDGHISAADRAAGAVVSNLPCGALYTTVIEDSAQGTVRVPELAGAHDLVLTFENGRIVAAEGVGGEAVLPWLESWDDGAARVSHVGLAVNPACRGGTGWTIVDEHHDGTVFLALGENRYMGGANASLLNHDIALSDATLSASGY